MRNLFFLLFAIFLGFGLAANYRATGQTNALHFDGVNDYVNITNNGAFNLGLSSQFTIEAWIKTGTGGTQSIFSKTDPAQNHAGYDFSIDNGQLNFRYIDNTGKTIRYYTQVSTFNDNNWHHVAISIYPPGGFAGVLFAVDGAKVQAAGATPPGMGGISNNNPPLLGIRHGSTNMLNGLIDEVRFWNYARSIEQLAAARTCMLNGNTPGLVLYYRFNEGNAGGINFALNTCQDSGPNNLDGQLFNFALTGSSSNWVDASANNVLKPCNVPEITSFSPESAVPGASITLTGSQFNPNPANNLVHFGNMKATVTAASANSLTVTLPQGAAHLPIQVTNTTDKFTGFSKKPFLSAYSPAKGNISGTDFAAMRTYATGANPGVMSTGDLDGDGRADIAVVNRNDGSISVFRNTGSGTHLNFAAKSDLTLAAAGANPRSLTIGDIDNDGKPEIVVSGYQQNNISIFRNTGSPGSLGFAARADYATPNTPLTTLVSDADADGLADIVFISQTTHSLVVLKNNATPGNISFASPVSFTAGSNPLDLVQGDFDGDGKIDFATLNGGSINISVFRNTTPVAGTIGFAKTEFSVVETVPLKMVTADFDQNGKPDLAVSQIANNTVAVFPNQSTAGNISFGAKSNFAVNAAPADIASGDMNGDGKPDIAIATPGNNSLTLLTNTGSGSIGFAGAVAISAATNPYGIALCDVNNDNRTDLLGTSAGTNQMVVFENITAVHSITAVSPFFGPPGTNVIIQGNGFVANNPAAHQVFFGGAKATVTSSLNGTLLFATAPTNATYKNLTVGISGKTAIHNRPFTTTFPGALPFSQNSFRFSDHFEAGSSPNDAVIADFDLDGKNDMMVPTWIGGTFTIFRNTTSGGFKPSFATAVNNSTGSLFFIDAADLDADGKPEVIGTSSSGIVVIKNNSSPGSISLDADPDYSSAGNFSNVTKASIADFDADGMPDMVLTSLASPVVVIMRNASFGGQFRFVPALTLSLPANGGGVAVGDFNADGKADIAATSPDNGSIYFFRNTSSGRILSFESAGEIYAGPEARVIKSADLDSDGKTDLVVSHFNSARITLWRNLSAQNGAINFTGAGLLNGTGTNTTTFEIADINGDIRPDIVANGNLNGNRLFAYMNQSSNGNLVFDGAAKAIPNGRPLAGIALGDIDGDAQPDIVSLATDNTPSAKVQLFINNITNPFISDINPKSGGPGTQVTITGTGFTNATGVFIGKWPVQSYTVIDDNTIHAVVGGGGTGEIKVTGVNGSHQTGCCTVWFSFYVHTLSTLDKNYGPAGAEIRIFGSGFLPGNTTDNIVMFGGTRATVVSATSGELKVKVPAGTTSDIPVTVSIYNNSVEARERFKLTYLPTANLNTDLYSSRTDFAVGGSTSAVAVADFDGDGKPDVAASTGSEVKIFPNTSTLISISAGTPLSLAAGSGAGQTVAQDLNGDGKPDIAVPNLYANTISIYKNTSTPGNISFTLVAHMPANAGPRQVLFTDVNRDGRLDMLAIDDVTNAFSLWKNNSIGNDIGFADKTEVNTVDHPLGIAAAKFSLTQGWDIATMSDDAGGTLSLIKNQSTEFNIQFSPRVSIPINNTGPRWMIPIDMDNTHATPDDIVACNAINQQVELFRNNSASGSFNFESKVASATGTMPMFVAQGSLNGDEKMDILTANAFSNSLSLLPNTTTGGLRTFGNKTDIVTLGITLSAAIADMNGDGRPDIISANGSASNYSVFRNSSPGLTSFSPTSAAAGQTITIIGNNLSNVTGVSFGGVAAYSFTVVSPSEIRARVANGNSGNITVSTSGGSYTIGGFIYMPSGPVLHVKAGAPAGNSGNSWDSACATLAEAVLRANLVPDIDTIKVAGGVYYPIPDPLITQRDSTLLFTRGKLVVWGGYNANTGERDPGANPTMISGNIGDAAQSVDNSYHLLVYTAPAGDSLEINGFSFENAQANTGGNIILRGINVSRGGGSAVYMAGNGHLILENCSVRNNLSILGGALFTNSGSLRLEKNLFENNASGYGGAIRAELNAQLYVNGNVFVNNNATTGGGGAMNNYKSALAKDTIVNNLFIRNKDISAGGNVGGALALVNGNHYVVNNTFFADTAKNSGGGVYILGPGNFALHNNIFYKNSAATGGDLSIAGTGINLTESANSMGGNNPLFINEDNLKGPDGQWFTADDGLRLLPHSSQINSGENNKLPAGITADITGSTRIAQGTVDKGAYENEGCSPSLTRLYVNAAVGNGNGTSWTSPLSSLQTALGVANGCAGIVEIWVAKGTYYPSSDNRNSSFVLKNGLAIYGGFNGNETGLSQRVRPWTQATILSGNGVAGKTKHVVRADNVNATAILDGFYIEDGFADNISDNRGAGIFINIGSPVIRNCIIRNNNTKFASSTDNGAGCAVSSNSEGVLFENCVFQQNQNDTKSISCAIAAYSGKITLNNCVFTQNTGVIYGGGITLIINNCSAANNTGHLFWLDNTQLTISNSLLKSGEVFLYNNMTVNVTNSMVPASLAGFGASNSTAEPGLVNELDADGADNTWGTLDDGFLPENGSPAVNAGNNTLVPASILFDLAGTPRKLFNTTDIGAYEGVNTAVRCPGSTFSYRQSADGSGHQWFAEAPGGSYVALTNSATFSGVNTAVLTITNAPANLAFTKIKGSRVAPGGATVFTQEFMVGYGSVWNGTGNANWNNGSNWSCGIPNNSHIAIIPLNTPNVPFVSNDSKAGGLLLFDGINLQIQEGAKLEIKK